MHHDLLEGEDYIGFNEIFTALIVDDNRLEQLRERFEIWMELAELTSFGMIDLATDEVTVVIQDDDGWFA